MKRMRVIAKVDPQDVVDELYRAYQMLERSIEVAQEAENVAWDVSKTLSPVENSIRNVRQLLDQIQHERIGI